MKSILIALFLVSIVSAPTAFSGETSAKTTTTTDVDKKPPHGDDGTGGNAGGGNSPVIFDR